MRRMAVLGVLAGAIWTSAMGEVRRVPSEYATIQAAVTDCNEGDTVLVADGIYRGEGNRDICLIPIAISIRSENGAGKCIIDCNGTEAENHRGFGGEYSISVIEGFTIINGYEMLGGAVLCINAELKIKGCVLKDNKASVNGGAICALGSRVSLSSSLVSRNHIVSTMREGAGLYCSHSVLSIDNCTIFGNTISNRPGCLGAGGIYKCETPMAIRNSVISGNYWTQIGGDAHPSDVVTYSIIEGGWEGLENRSVAPGLTYDGHLCAGSPCIDAADPNTDPNGVRDADGEVRQAGTGVDIGADEFVDSDADGLPDWWEERYFGSATGADANANPDADDYSNREEHNVYLTSPLIAAKTIYVDANAGDDTRDGLTWETAKRSIQAGIGAVGERGDQVVIGPGVYTGGGNQYLDLGGKPIIVRSTNPQDESVVASTIIDANDGNVLNLDDLESGLCRISGLTIRNGYADYWVVRFGPGSEAVMSNCVLTGSRGWYAAVYIENGSPRIENCRIIRNNVVAIRCDGGAPEIVNCTISDNYAQGQKGAALSCLEGHVTMTNCVISRNQSGDSHGDGVAIFTESSSITVTNCTIAHNNNKGWLLPYWGCQVYTIGGGSTIRNCILWSSNPYEVRAQIVANSCVKGGYAAGSGIIDKEPMLTYDGHLMAGSPCIDVTAPNDPNIGILPVTDIDGEGRIMGGGLDIGADEFSDVDGDGMADWYEQEHFGSATAGERDVDADIDDHNNLDEYRYYSSDPTVAARKIYVDVSRTNDEGDGLSWETAKRTIQAGVDIAESSDYVIIAPGTYNDIPKSFYCGIDPRGKPIIIQSTNPFDPDTVGETIIDPNGSGSAFCIHSGETRGCRISGFTLRRAGGPWYDADIWSAIYVALSDPIISNCVVHGNLVVPRNSGPVGIYCQESNAVIENCTLYNGWGHGVWLIGPEQGNEWHTPTVENCQILGGTGGLTFYRVDAEIADCEIISTMVIAVYCYEAAASIRNCRLSGSMGDGIGCIGECNISLVNDTITGNRQNGISLGATSNLFIRNTIMRDNEGTCIYCNADCNVGVVYSNIQGGWEGVGNIDCDPCFVRVGQRDDNGTSDDPWDDIWIEGDYHLRSEGWRWDVGRETWTWDEVTSRCIDAGCPAASLGDEPVTLNVDPDNEFGVNLRVDMGAYGGTGEASMGPEGWSLLGDLTNDGIVNGCDYSAMVMEGAAGGANCGDVNRDGAVDMYDVAELAGQWLAETTWY